MAGIDFFDVDHTITRRSSGTRFISLAIRRGVLPYRLLLVVPWYSLAYKYGFFRMREYTDGFPYLRGIARSTLEEIARESFETRLKLDIYPGAVEILEERRRAGRRVMLATSSFDIIVQPLAEHLGVDGVLASALEFDGDTCTGRITGIPMFRAEKRERVLRFLRERGEDPGDCSFHSDSIYDLPLLEAVGKPVAVNADYRLRRIARSRGWRVIDLS